MADCVIVFQMLPGQRLNLTLMDFSARNDNTSPPSNACSFQVYILRRPRCTRTLTHWRSHGVWTRGGEEEAGPPIPAGTGRETCAKPLRNWRRGRRWHDRRENGNARRNPWMCFSFVGDFLHENIDALHWSSKGVRCPGAKTYRWHPQFPASRVVAPPRPTPLKHPLIQEP